jgi:3-phosphoshikimate 1-carboxyvinyltransferase
MLQALGVRLGQRGDALVLESTGDTWRGFEFDVPGDLSGAAFFVASCLASGTGALRVQRVGLNPGRSAYLRLLQAMGADIAWSVEGEQLGEPWGSFEVQGVLQRPLELAGEAVVQCLDEIPALLAACAASGVAASLRDAAELRVKESDRIAGLAALLRAFGATVREHEDGLDLEANCRLRAARISSRGDHRLAMAAAILAAQAEGTSRIEGVGCVRTSYPNFSSDFQRLTVA